ncbi:hypothetical protein C6A46_18100 [Escherichia coli]|nr:hypothetical protein C6A46_18100 [Escherichia coli]
MEFTFRLWEVDQKTVKKFRHSGVFFMKLKFIFHALLKNKTFIINQLKQKKHNKKRSCPLPGNAISVILFKQ